MTTPRQNFIKMLRTFEKSAHDKRQMTVESRTSEAGAEAGAGGGGIDSDAAEGEPAPWGPTIHVLTLNHGEHQDSTLYRFEKGDVVHFCPGTSLLGRRVYLYTNYVVRDTPEEEKTAEFVRSQYHLLGWWRNGAWLSDGEGSGGPWREGGAAADPAAVSLGPGAVVTDTDIYCELRLHRAGAFHYYFVYDTKEAVGSGWYSACGAGAGGAGDARVLTLVARVAGPLARWAGLARAARDAGYSALHVTPVQARGPSGSAYSLLDQRALDPGLRAAVPDLARFIADQREQHQMMCISDVVLNHTSNETSWVSSEPSATYNCANTPRLRPAALLDAALARLTRRVAAGHAPVPRLVTAEEHVQALHHLLSSELVPSLRLAELYSCDVAALLAEFDRRARAKLPPPSAATAAAAAAAAATDTLRLLQDPLYRRMQSTVDMDLALQLYNVYWPECYDEESRLRRCGEELRRRLEALNAAVADEIQGHLRAAIDNCAAGIRYFRLQEDGPKIAEVSDKHPLVPRYFTWESAETACALEDAAGAERAVWGEAGAGAGAESGAGAEAGAGAGARVAAHNGWVMGADPLQDFALHTHVYLRRELIAWGDSVKLRYGSCPEDSPFLWAHMRQYVEQTAELFDGVRLDNCHSTPLHVAEYMLDCARNVKPDLLVFAELFTNSDHVDNVFVNRLGVTALIREAATAWDARELGRLVHRYGGRAVAAPAPRSSRARAAPRVAPALLMDHTHDNQAPMSRRSAWDLMATSALVAAADCATGSTRGYDELVPHQVDVVEESRLYPEWSPQYAESGIVAAKRAINQLHQQLHQEGYCEIYVDQMDDDVVAVTRQNPQTRESVIIVAFTAFNVKGSSPPPARPVPTLRFEGQLDQVIFEADLEYLPSAGEYVRDPSYVTGLPQYAARVSRPATPADARLVAGVRREGAHCAVELRPLRPGAVLALRASPPPAAAAALRRLRRVTALPLEACPPGLAPVLAALDLSELSALLYRCEEEERADSAGAAGAYVLPGAGALPYAGLEGLRAPLDALAAAGAATGALADHLRAGDWLPEYCAARLERRGGALAAAGAWLRAALAPALLAPRYLRPALVEAVLARAAAAARREALRRLAVPGAGRSPLARALALTSLQLVSRVPGASLPPPAPPLAPSMSAGLPHFATGYMRCWGRDTFISLRGLLLLTGRYEEARTHLLSFGACLRHGLVPNLLDGGARPRYNCRDAVWWWAAALRHCCAGPGPGPAAGPGPGPGPALLRAPVPRLFPAEGAPATQPLHDVLQEALDTHFQGLVFVERDAGRAIDEHMTERGFTVQIGVDPDTGFVFGGNQHNAGTWMDKMGSSDKAGNRGRPATPRDGSAIELVALCYSTVSWLAEAHRAGDYPYPGVTRRHSSGAVTAWTWEEWAARIKDNFEKHFWIGDGDHAHETRPDLVHRRGIYKDSVGASSPWADYQLRPNLLLALCAAPALFAPSRARAALDNVERLLLGPLGVKTLDPGDWNYRPDYDNGDDSADPSTAHGFNYHQGPEWVWLLGVYLRARLLFPSGGPSAAAAAAAAVRARLGRVQAALQNDPWRALPELTNADGRFCRDSCRSQAWSSATVLEVLHELAQAD